MKDKRGTQMAEVTGLDRRDLLRHGLVWGGAAGIGALGAAASASANRPAGTRSARRSRRVLALDVACIGDTLRLVPATGSGSNPGTPIVPAG